MCLLIFIFPIYYQVDSGCHGQKGISDYMHQTICNTRYSNLYTLTHSSWNFLCLCLCICICICMKYNQRRYCLCLVLGVLSVFVLLVEFVFVIVFAYVFVFECIYLKYNQRRQCLWAGLVYRWLRREVR